MYRGVVSLPHFQWLPMSHQDCFCQHLLSNLEACVAVACSQERFAYLSNKISVAAGQPFSVWGLKNLQRAGITGLKPMLPPAVPEHGSPNFVRLVASHQPRTKAAFCITCSWADAAG